jgi:putative endonuclease
MSQHNRDFGRSGEELARRYLEEKGFRWVASNLETKFGELDLIMTHGATMVFVEVKRRRDDQFGEPEEAVTRTKKDHMIKSALSYLDSARIQDRMVRFDVVSIGPRGIRHYRNAFSAGGSYYY